MSIWTGTNWANLNDSPFCDSNWAIESIPIGLSIEIVIGRLSSAKMDMQNTKINAKLDKYLM